jgi:DDE family transposase
MPQGFQDWSDPEQFLKEMFDRGWTFRRALFIVSSMALSSPLVAVDKTSDGLQTSLGAATADVLSLFLRLLPAGFFARLREEEKLRENNRIYNAAVVMWLMTQQRLQGNASLESGVQELVRGLSADFWPRPCKRLLPGPEGQTPTLSGNTGSYNEARQRLPVNVVEVSFDHVFDQLAAELRPAGGTEFPAYFVDGTSVRTAHSDALYEAFPPGSNQHGEAHWPLLRMLVAHDLHTGLAMRPGWGPMYGPQAVSEQGLLEQAIDRLPAQSILVGDANFGIFSVAWAADRRSHPVILRLTTDRARRLAGGELQDGTDRRIQWKPSRDDRRSHPELPADACVAGRLIVQQVQPGNGSKPFLLALFTTLEWPADEIVQFYGKRWNIETDLRSLKSTLELEQLTCTTPEMVAKEIDVGMLAYNLVRAVTCLAAQTAGLTPRSFGFTRVRNVINAFTPLIAAAKSEEEARKLFDKMMYYVGQAKLPKRTRQRPSYPRAVWDKRQAFPKRSG